MSRRTEQVSSVLREEIQRVLDRGLNDPRVGGLLTVTSVRVAPDFKSAVVRVSVMPEDRQELALHGLRSAAGHVRSQVGRRLPGRQVPALGFELDESLKKQARVFQAISEAARASGAEGGARP